MDLERLRADNFAEGNIVANLYHYTGKNCADQEKDIRAALSYLLRIDREVPDRTATAMTFLNKEYRRIAEGELELLELEPSYGCNLVALGKKVKLPEPGA